MSRRAIAWRRLGRYAAALGVVAAATLGRLALRATIGDQLPHSFLFLAVGAVAWFWGKGPALLAIVAALGVTAWLLPAPEGVHLLDPFTGAANVAVFALLEVAIAALAVRGRRAKREHVARRRELEVEVAERRQVERALTETTAEVRALNATLEARVAERTAEVARLADHLRALASELADVEQQERRRLALILHDHVQQILVGARMQVEALRRRLGDPSAPELCLDLDASLREAIDASRSLAVELSPPVLRDAGIGPALTWLAARMRDRHGLVVTLTCDAGPEPSDQGRALLFECTRELLLNVVKHAGVHEASISLQRAGGRVRIVVQDAGEGFDPAVLARRDGDPTFGLFSIQQRLAYVGGDCRVDSAPGRGTRVTMSIPVADRRAGATPRVTPAATAGYSLSR
jgi:signal transduction histidine kinase